MKVGILTYYGDLNCGTNLQAYATLEAVRSVYSKETDIVEIIPFHGFHPRILPYKSFSPRSILRDISRIFKYKKFKNRYLKVEDDVVIRDVEKAVDFIKSKGYDVIYVGADTLLELDKLPPNYDGLSAYWLKGIPGKKILIAASGKDVTYEKLSDTQKLDMSQAVNEFSFRGVRDEGTYSLLENFVNETELDVVPDPTFILDIDYTFIEKYLKAKRISIPKKSVLLHTFGDDHWAEDLARKFRKDGYYIVAPRPMSWADLCLNDMAPFEQLGIYSYFEVVITHRFHDGIFCLKNNTPFMLYEKGYNYATTKGDSKFTTLLKEFDLYETNYIGRGSEVSADRIYENVQNAIKHFKLNSDEILAKVSRKREDYFSFLTKTLESDK